MQQAAGHTEPECLGYTAYDPSSYQAPVLVCLDPDSHDEQEAATRGSVNATPRADDIDWESRRAESARQAAERLAASKVRVDHIAAVLRTALPAKGKHAATLAGATRAFLPVAMTSQNLSAITEPAVLHHALGVEVSSDWREAIEQRATHAASLATAATDASLLDALAGVLAALVDTVLSNEGEGSDDAALADVAWDWLTSSGYELTDVDDATRAAVTATDEEAEDD